MKSKTRAMLNADQLRSLKDGNTITIRLPKNARELQLYYKDGEKDCTIKFNQDIKEIEIREELATFFKATDKLFDGMGQMFDRIFKRV